MAGLFDGEGSIGFVMYGNKNVYPSLQLSMSSAKHRALIVEFLKSKGIVAREAEQTNHLGHSGIVAIKNWKSAQIFIRNIASSLIQKREPLLLMNEAIQYHLSSHRKPEEELEFLDALRKKIHSYAKKGRRNLKPWFPLNGRGLK